MKKLPVVITIVTLYALFFQLTPYMGIPANIIFCMFLLSPFLGDIHGLFYLKIWQTLQIHL